MRSAVLASDGWIPDGAVRQRRMRGWVLFVQGMLFLGTMAYAWAVPAPPPTALFPLCLATLAMTLWIGWTLPCIQRDVFNLYSLFILSLVLFNAGRIFLEVVDLNPDGMLSRYFLDGTWTRTVVLVLVSMAGFHMGGMLCACSRRLVPPSCRAKTARAPSSRPIAAVGVLILLVAAIPFMAVTLRNLQIVMAEGYFGLFARERAYGLETGVWGVLANLARFALPGLALTFAGWSDHPKKRKMVFTLFVAYGLIQLFLGRRSWGSMSLLSATWLWHVFVRPIPLKRILACGLVMLFVAFPTIKVFRGETGQERLSLPRIRAAFASIENPAITIISEMGRSMWCIAYVLEWVPDTRSYEYGRTYAYAATAVLPNFFWRIHPATEHGNLARWLVMTVAPETWENGGGFGFSCIAEAYVNFGWSGTPLAMMFMGYLIARGTRWGGRGDPLSKAIIAIIMAYILMWARGDVTLFVRSLGWGAFLPYLAIRQMQRNESRRAKGAAARVVPPGAVAERIGGEARRG